MIFIQFTSTIGLAWFLQGINHAQKFMAQFLLLHIPCRSAWHNFCRAWFLLLQNTYHNFGMVYAIAKSVPFELAHLLQWQLSCHDFWHNFCKAWFLHGTVTGLVQMPVSRPLPPCSRRRSCQTV